MLLGKVRYVIAPGGTEWLFFICLIFVQGSLTPNKLEIRKIRTQDHSC